MSPKKKKKVKITITPEKIARAFDKLNRQAIEITFEVDEIKKFVTEAITVFVSDTRFLVDQIAILAERLAELENLALEKSKETE